MIDQNNLEMKAHCDEFEETVKYIRDEIKNQKNRENGPTQSSPKGFTNLVISSYKKAEEHAKEDDQLECFKALIKDPVRKVHDFYGWKSFKKNKLKKSLKGEDPLSVCKGTIYRSIEFMDVEMDDRSGANRDRGKPKGVHIEHTIPVNQIVMALWQNRKKLKIKGKFDGKRVFDFWLMLSVGTAMTRKEEKDDTVIEPQLRSKHPNLTKDGKPKGVEDYDNICPFERYEFPKGFEIYEMIGGTKITAKDWTLRKHLNLLQKHSNIYKYDDSK